MIRIGAVAVAALHVGAMVTAGRMLGEGPLEVAGMPLTNPSTPAFTESLADVSAASYETAVLTVEGAPAAARWLLWGAQTLPSLATIGICVALIWLCLRVARQQPFGRSVSFALLTTASLVVLAGIGGQVLAAMGRTEIADHLGGAATAGSEGFSGFFVDLSLSSVGIALAIGVLAAAFEIGERLQRDTEGLV